MNKVAVLALLFAVAGFAQADVKSEINAANNKIDRAIKAKDAKLVESTMRESVTKDFKYVEGSKSQDFKTFITNLNSSVVVMDKITLSKSRMLSIKQKGNHGTGKMEHIIVGTMKSPDKKTHTMSWTGVFTETYVRVDGKWKTSIIVPKTQKYLMDGKPLGTVAVGVPPAKK